LSYSPGHYAVGTAGQELIGSDTLVRISGRVSGGWCQCSTASQDAKGSATGWRVRVAEDVSALVPHRSKRPRVSQVVHAGLRARLAATCRTCKKIGATKRLHLLIKRLREETTRLTQPTTQSLTPPALRSSTRLLTTRSIDHRGPQARSHGRSRRSLASNA